MKTGRRTAIKASLLPLLLLFLPPAILFPEPVLRTAFLVILSLYLSGRLYSGHIRKHIHVQRICGGDCLFYGEEDRVTITVANSSRLPALNILVSDAPDFQLNFLGRQRFLISLKGKSKTRIQYRIKGTSRGQFPIRDLSTEAADIFGQFPWKHEDTLRKIITVYPRVFPLSSFYRTYRQPFGSIRNKYPIFEELSRREGIRPFQSGDERKRINWKQSARSGELLVNQYMPSISQKTVILLNQFNGDYDFRYREFYTELALEIAVSCASHLIRNAQECGIQLTGEFRNRIPEEEGFRDASTVERFRVSPGSGGRTLRDIFHLLACIHPQDSTPFISELHPGNMKLTYNTAILIISPDLDSGQCTRIGELKQQGFDPAVLLFGPVLQSGYGLKQFAVPLYRIRRDEGILMMEPLNG